MAWHPVTIVRVLAPIALLACGGGKKTTTQRTTPTADVKPLVPPVETDADREKKRNAEALAIVPEGSSCLPVELKNANAPKLELAVKDEGVLVCAVDQDRTRLLGPVGCWSVEIKDAAHRGALTYQAPTPLPGRGLSVMFDDRCARGYCLPKDAKVPADAVALIAWNLDGSKVAVLAGDNVYIFVAASKAYESSFPIRGDKAGDKGVTSEPTALHWNGDALFIEASDGTTSPVWVFKPDGIAVGPIEALGGKDKALLSTRNGSFVLLAPGKVGISEQGFSALTTYELEAGAGKRAKVVRKLPASTCKKDELDALWREPNPTLSPKCKEYVSKNYEHLIGAEAIAGSKNLLVLLRGPRLGELAVIDPKTLAEKQAIKMAWCDAAGGGAEKTSSAAPAAAKESEKADKAPAKPAKKGSPSPKASKGDDAEDPDSGGQ